MSWISIKDKLPKEYEPVLVARDIGDIRIGYLREWEKPFFVVPVYDGEQMKQFEVIYWQPLPTYPDATRR